MELLNSKPDLSITRIYDRSNQKVVGAGFLVSNKYILTCAHVIAFALNIDSTSHQKPTEEIRLDFPTIEAGGFISAKVDFWLPVKPNTSPEDIAVLRLIESPPISAKPAVLSMEDLLLNHQFDALGFPDGRENGAWVEGIIKRNVAHGWIQLEAKNVTGYRLEEGFSGTPIWDNQIGAIVGMAVAADKRRPEVKAAFMIPIELISNAWNNILTIASFVESLVESPVESLVIIIQPYFHKLRNEIVTAYKKSLPEFSVHYIPESLQKIVKNLHNCQNTSENNYSCLENFIGYLYLQLQESEQLGLQKICQSLINWLQQYYGTNYQDLIASLQQNPSSDNQDSCLLVAIFEDNNSYNVEGWLIKDQTKYHPNENPDCYPLNEDNKIKIAPNLNKLEEKIGTLIDQCIDMLNYQDLQKIHFFLPSKLIVKNVELLYSLILPQSRLNRTIGAEYEISIRLANRLRGAGKRHIARWLQKGKLLNNQKNKRAIDVIRDKVYRSNGQLMSELDSKEIVAIRLNEVIKEKKLEQVIDIFLETGIPLALWVRQDIENLNYRQALTQIYEDCSLNELSERVRTAVNIGMDQTCHIGNCLCLLWDDPILIPPKYKIEMP